MPGDTLMPRKPEQSEPQSVEVMNREALEAEILALRQQLADAPPAREAAPPAEPAVALTDTDIAPPWDVPRQACGRFDLLQDGISAYVFDGHRMREFIPGQRISNVTVGVKRTVLATITLAADQYRLNMTNRGQIVQNAPLEFDA
jgi:hypothetical protein